MRRTAPISSLLGHRLAKDGCTAMLNYKLLCRDADGELMSSQNVLADTDSGAIGSALDLAQSALYELWLGQRRLAIFELNEAKTIEPTQSPPRRTAKLRLWPRKRDSLQGSA
jgi:hypothetical protein